MKKAIVLLFCAVFGATLILAQEAAAPAETPAAAPAVATEKAPEAAPAAAAPAADTKAPAMLPLELRKTGTVSVIKDASGKMTAIKLVVTSYDIMLDDEGKKLEAMDGQKVRITCTLSHENGKRVLTVKSMEPVAEAGAAPAAAAPAAPAVPVTAPAAATPAEAPAAK